MFKIRTLPVAASVLLAISAGAAEPGSANRASAKATAVGDDAVRVIETRPDGRARLPRRKSVPERASRRPQAEIGRPRIPDADALAARGQARTSCLVSSS